MFQLIHLHIKGKIQVKLNHLNVISSQMVVKRLDSFTVSNTKLIKWLADWVDIVIPTEFNFPQFKSNSRQTTWLFYGL